ncbi:MULTISPECIES: aspartyl/asparaginyl beta-hydroxylase domain-containing protein [unclassified Streptomyces]|uniref:aspartyl/asparaginyl beta-hydroxylase domain-containing protein n=1 Tax=unclassified Streptomyces TaxID=2593676 RepID=UPI0037F72D12
MVTTLPAAATPEQTGPGRAEVLDQVARLADLEESAVEQMRAEALGAPTRGVVAYGEYQSGGWWTASLLNHTGDPHDVVIGDGRPRPTSLLEAMPATARFLDSLGLDFMYVRLARLEQHSYLWEHRDYAELRERGRHRLHIPLVTNPSAVLITAGARVHLAAGSLWRLTPSRAHGVCNTTGPDRLHLIADVYTDDAYRIDSFVEKMISGEDMPKGDPVLFLRNRAVARMDRSLTVKDKVVLYGTAVKAWNAHAKEETVSFLRFIYDEKSDEGMLPVSAGRGSKGMKEKIPEVY